MAKRIIYKYRFEEHEIHAGKDYIMIPAGKVLLVAQQNMHSLPTLWVEHTDPFDQATSRKYRLAGTGHLIDEEFTAWEHVGSCICEPLVWHVYREPIQ